MTTASFLRSLAERDIRLSLKGERLHCSAAEGALTPELREEIAARKGEITDFLGQVQNTGLVLRRAPLVRRVPLSFAQKRLWFLHKRDPDDPAYNLGMTFSLPGDLDRRALSTALRELAARQQILRTVFEEIDGEVAQVVTDVYPELQQIDVREVRTASEFERIRDTETKRPFRLNETPAVRAFLLLGPAGTCGVLIVIHHILADGWSLDVFFEQLMELYEACRAERPPTLAAPQWHYADFAASQADWWAETDVTAHADYWKQKLGGSPPLLDLPFDRPRGSTVRSPGGVHQFRFPADLANRLREVARQSRTTLFNVMLAIFFILLSRYSGQARLVIGSPFANRSRVESEPVIGLFASTLALHADLSGDPAFLELLDQVRNTVLEAFAHQDYPFEKIVEMLAPDRSLKYSPLFQAAFILNNEPRSPRYDLVCAGAVFELSLYLWDGAEDLPGCFEFNTDLFDHDTIVRMAGHLRTLTEAAVTDPGGRISQLPILTGPEKTQLVERWNDTLTAYPRREPVHALFEQQTDATPDAVAVIVPGGGASQEISLSYREIDQRANQMARYLLRLGVEHGSRVGIALRRSSDFVVSALATLKAGAAYVPIDPGYPQERIAAILEDSRISVLVTHGSDGGGPPQPSFTVLNLDRASAAISAETDVRLPVVVAAEALAYIMYTSGSTGVPKGVCVPHRAIVRLVRNTNYAELTNREVILACAPVSFDASTLEIWGSLLNGGRLVVYPGPVPEPGQLAAAIQQYNVTTLWLTAGLFHLVAETHPEAFAGLRQLLAGGDVLSPSHVRKAIRAMKGGVLINGYGPTENTTFTCCHRMTKEEHVGATVPIGRPISNTRVYVLDAGMQPVPVGVRGELWTGGDGVADGYWNDPVLTAERFHPDPFSKDPQARLYRTGDIVRYRPDGALEFLGRVDKQFKVRGFRVEAGEVERALIDHPAVREAIVVARERSVGSKQLIGYLILNQDHAAPVEEIKAFLTRRLPEYAVPSALLILDSFPLNPNGKVDHQALPAPPEPESPQSRPLTALETQLLLIWENVLGIGGIGVHDNFFALGGNSLLGVRLLAKLEKVLKRRIPVSVLFEGQTVESMAVALGRDLDGASFRVVAIQPSGERPPLFVIPGVSGDVIGYEGLARALGPDQPMYGCRSVGLDGETEPLERIDEIAAMFLKEIRKLQPHGPYRLLGFCMGGLVAYEMARQMAAEGIQPELLGLIDTYPPAAIPRKPRMMGLAQSLAFFRQGAARHMAIVRELPVREGIRYLFEKAGILREMVVRRDVYRGDDHTRHRDLVAQANQRAASSYKLAPYPHDVVLVAGRPIGKNDPKLIWEDLARGGCNVRRLEAKNSGYFLKPPLVQALGEILQAVMPANTEVATTS